MFTIWSSTEAPVKGKIVFKRFPVLGNQTDLSGKIWRVSAIHDGWVNACPMEELNEYFHSTEDKHFGLVQQTWDPYYFEIKEA